MRDKRKQRTYSLTTKLTTQHQATVPVDIRRVLRLGAGDAITWSRDGYGDTVKVRKQVSASDPFDPVNGPLPTIFATAGFNGPGRTSVAIALASASKRVADNLEDRVGLLDLHASACGITIHLQDRLGRLPKFGFSQLLQAEEITSELYDECRLIMEVVPETTTSPFGRDGETIHLIPDGNNGDGVARNPATEESLLRALRAIRYFGDIQVLIVDLDPYLSSGLAEAMLPLVTGWIYCIHGGYEAHEIVRRDLLQFADANPDCQTAFVINQTRSWGGLPIFNETWGKVVPTLPTVTKIFEIPENAILPHGKHVEPTLGETDFTFGPYHALKAMKCNPADGFEALVVREAQDAVMAVEDIAQWVWEVELKRQDEESRTYRQRLAAPSGKP